MTKITIIGKKPRKPKIKKVPIEFFYELSAPKLISITYTKPYEFKNVELIAKNYFPIDTFGEDNSFDLIFAYDEDRHDGDGSMLFLGNWNDGVVE